MSLPTETLLLQVDVQANNARLVELQKSLNDNKLATAALNAAFKEGKLTQDEYAQGQVRLKQAASDTSQEMRVLTKANADQKKATDEAKGSINQLRAELSRGTAAYNALSQSERENTAAGQKLQAANKALSDELKTLEGAIGDNRRQVGGYKDAIKDAIKESGLFGGVTQRLSGAQEKYAAAQKIVAVVTGETTGVTKALRVAFLAIPLFAVIALLGTLYTFLTSTQKGMDFVERKTAAVGAVFNVLLKIIQPVGEAMLRLFTDPKQAITDLISFLETNVANRFKAFGVLVDAIRNRDFTKLADGVIQLGTGIADGTAKAKALVTELGNAATAQEKLTAETQRIRAAERALNVERDQSRAKIEGLKKLSDDSTKSTDVRAAAAKEAATIENALLERQLKLQGAKVANLQAEQRLKGNITNADKDELAALKSEQAKTAQESLTLQTELQNKINSIATEAATKAEARRKTLDEAALKRTEEEIADATAREERAAKYLDDQLKGDQLRVASAQKAIDEKKAADEAAYKRDLKNLESNLEGRRVLLETDKAMGLVTQEQYEARLSVIDEGGYSARLLLARHYGQDVNEAEKAQARAHNAIVEKQTTKEKIEYQKRLAIAQAFGSDLGVLLAQTLTETGQSLESFAGKFLILLLDTLEKQVLAGQVAILVTSLSTKGVAGLIEAAALTATVTAAFEAAKATISIATTPAFATGGVPSDGGMIHGAGTGTSDSIVARVSNGESIINARSTQMFRPVLSYLNELGGGRSFAGGYAAGGIPLQGGSIDGGYVERYLAGASPPSAKEIAYELAKVIPSQIQVTAINDAQRRRAQVVGRATLGR